MPTIIGLQLYFNSVRCLSFANVMFQISMALHNFKESPKYVTLAISSPSLDNMWFFYHPPSGWRSLVGYLCSSKGRLSSLTRKISCIPSLQLSWDKGVEEHPLLIGHFLAFGIATRLSSTCSSHFS